MDLEITILAHFHPLSPFPASGLAPEQSLSHPRSDTTLFPKAAGKNSDFLTETPQIN